MASPKQELGAAYDEVMRSKVFEPLRMTHTTFDFATALSGNFASPHDDSLVRLVVRSVPSALPTMVRTVRGDKLVLAAMVRRDFPSLRMAKTWRC